jgi:hypothetical protein
LFHQLGQGVTVNRVEAQKWHFITEALTPDAESFISKVNGKYMTEDQIAEARGQADDWLASHADRVAIR